MNRVPPVVKLLEVEDGAVWEGQERTYVTEERASIALAALATATVLIYIWLFLIRARVVLLKDFKWFNTRHATM